MPVAAALHPNFTITSDAPATAARIARATRFLEHVPPALTDDLLVVLRTWRAGRDSAGDVVADLGRRLRQALACPLDDETRRGDLDELLGALSTHRRAAIELVAWACKEAGV